MNPFDIKNIVLGGIAESDHLGRSESEMGSIVGLDLHGEIGTIRVNQKLVKDSGATITEFVKDIVESSNGDLYFFSSESGKIWMKDVSADTYSLVDTTSPTDGEAKCLGAIEFGGYIYWATQNWLHRIAVKGLATWSTSSEENWKPLHEFDGAVTTPPLVLKLNGTDQYATTSSQTLGLSNADIFTFECWFKLTANGAEKRCELFQQSTGQFKVALGAINSDSPYAISVIESGVSSVGISAANVFKRNEWTHLVITRNSTGSGNLKMYVNGEAIAVTDENPSNSFVDTTSIKTIGVDDAGYNFYFGGDISVMNVYNGVLSASEITALYEGLYKGGSSASISWSYNAAARDLDVTFLNGASLAYATDFLTSDSEPRYPHFVQANTAVVENDGSKKEIYALQTPISRVDVFIAEKGSANVTCVLHDADNNSLASVTVTNANITEGAWNTFNFTDFDIEYGTKIHAHIYASGSGVYLVSRNLNNGADIALKIYSEGSTDCHAMKIVNRDLYIADRNYIHKVTRSAGDGKQYFISNALDLPQPYKISAIGKIKHYLVIGAGVGDDIHKSAFYVWNTWSVSFDREYTIEEDGIHAIIDDNNQLLISAGKHGNLYAFDGDSFLIVRQIKGSYFPSGGSDVGVKVNRNAYAMYKRLPMFGLSNVSGNPALQGIYSYGSRSMRYPAVLNLEYPLSPRDSGAFVMEDLEIGAMVVNSGLLYVTWRHDTDGAGTYAYGVDVIDMSNKLEKGYFETRYISEGKDLSKSIAQYFIGWKSLPSGTALKLQIDKDYGGYGSEQTFIKEATWSRSKLNLATRFNTLRLKVILETATNDTPIVEHIRLVGER